MQDIPVFLRGDGRPLRVTRSNARRLYFFFDRNNPLNPSEKHLLEMPEHKQRPCGGVLAHLYQRCTEHDALCEAERDHLERSLNRLLVTQKFALSSSEGRLSSGVVPTKRPGQHKEVLYFIRCGLLFVVRPIRRECLTFFETKEILREDTDKNLILLSYRGVQSEVRQGQLTLKLVNYFDTKEDRSMPLFEFIKTTQRLYSIERVLPSEEDIYSALPSHRRKSFRFFPVR